jgi:hypothetical protein
LADLLPLWAFTYRRQQEGTVSILGAVPEVVSDESANVHIKCRCNQNNTVLSFVDEANTFQQSVNEDYLSKSLKELVLPIPTSIYSI